MQKNKVAVLLLAAGKGKRFDKTFPKQYHKINDTNLLDISINQFLHNKQIDKIFIIINAAHKKLISPNKNNKIIYILNGGVERQDSSRNGLVFINNHYKNIYDIILIHDVARPLVDNNLIAKLIESTNKNQGVIPAIKINEAIKIDQQVAQKYANSFIVQTPQAFFFTEILKAHNKYKDNNFDDDSSIFEQYGGKIKIINGNKNNIKITYQEDMQNMTQNYENRIGNGIDIHKFDINKKYIILGGIKIDCGFGLKAHSDGDIILHALTDSIYGAIGGRDIGYYFSPSESKWKDCASTVFLEHALSLLSKNMGKIINLDINIICEKLKISPHAEAIISSIANLCNIKSNQIAIKANTAEKMGFIGREEGMMVMVATNIQKLKL